MIFSKHFVQNRNFSSTENIFVLGTELTAEIQNTIMWVQHVLETITKLVQILRFSTKFRPKSYLNFSSPQNFDFGSGFRDGKFGRRAGECRDGDEFIEWFG